jgi:DNA-binding MarR family transcriptional regulator
MGARRSRATLYRAIQALQRLAALFERRRQQLAREAGLSDAQWRLLEEIGREDCDFMPSLFARSREMHAAAVSRTLRQLQEGKLVTVSISSRDARQRNYQLTTRGRRLLERLQASRGRAIDEVWAGLPGDRLADFARFSEQLADRLEEYARREDGGR